MGRGKPKPLFYVCACVSDGALVMESILANTPAEATQKFKEKYAHSPERVYGPFMKKRTQVVENTRELKFASPQVAQRAIFNDWIVNAFILEEPENQAYLVFIKRADDKKMQSPKGTITVPVSDLRFI